MRNNTKKYITNIEKNGYVIIKKFLTPLKVNHYKNLINKNYIKIKKKNT